MTFPRSIVDIMRDVVSEVSDAKLASLIAANGRIQSINYLYGHPAEIVATLSEWSQSATKKFDRFPVIMLFTDVPEVMSESNGQYFAEVNLNIVLAMYTDANLKAAERRVKNFVPVLQPLYEELLEQISQQPDIVYQAPLNISHTKYDRYYWGRESINGTSANKFNDNIDAIEIQNLKLKISNLQ